jgi:aspartyl-tRNA(Asn)/glutamyl-tRNA(Gln) amidotransferase subunit B
MNLDSCRLTNELLGQLSFREISFKENPISPTQLGELIDLLARKTITGASRLSF